MKEKIISVNDNKTGWEEKQSPSIPQRKKSGAILLKNSECLNSRKVIWGIFHKLHNTQTGYVVASGIKCINISLMKCVNIHIT